MCSPNQLEQTFKTGYTAVISGGPQSSKDSPVFTSHLALGMLKLFRPYYDCILSRF